MTVKRTRSVGPEKLAATIGAEVTTGMPDAVKRWYGFTPPPMPEERRLREAMERAKKFGG